MSNYKIKSYKPFYNRMLVTSNKIQLKKADGTIQDTTDLKPYQTIISLGQTCVKDLNVGDTVLIVPDRYQKKRYKDSKIQGTSNLQQDIEYYYEFNVVEVDGIEYLEIFDGDIKAIVTVEESEPTMFITGALNLNKDADFKKAKLDPKGLLEV